MNTDYTPTRPADFDYDAALSDIQEKIRRKKKAKNLLAHYAEEAARELGSSLGRGCKIVTGRKKGRIELEYYGLDDLNDLLDALHTLKKK